MALISCPECSGKVSTRASACPHCGLDVSKLSECPECGAQMLLGIAACTECGCPMGNAQVGSAGSSSEGPAPGEFHFRKAVGEARQLLDSGDSHEGGLALSRICRACSAGSPGLSIVKDVIVLAENKYAEEVATEECDVHILKFLHHCYAEGLAVTQDPERAADYLDELKDLEDCL